MPGMLQVGNTSSLFIQGAGPNGMRGAMTGACKDVVEQREQQPTATAAPAALEEEDRRGQAMADTDTTVTATPAAGSNDREQVKLNEEQEPAQPRQCRGQDSMRKKLDEAEPPEQPMSPTSQEDATPEGVKLTKREIGKAERQLSCGALDNELKTFKTKAQLTLMGVQREEKAHWEAAAEVWAARTHTRFESFLEKDLHFFETHATPGTPAPDAHLKELAADYMARGMARELMYHAVWIKGKPQLKGKGGS
ncbi:unnamed protein product [Closterium sp. NIES-64]|nr:unnamed protein product [Closterium sp. NIES-64]